MKWVYASITKRTLHLHEIAFNLIPKTVILHKSNKRQEVKE